MKIYSKTCFLKRANTCFVKIYKTQALRGGKYKVCVCACVRACMNEWMDMF